MAILLLSGLLAGTLTQTSLAQNQDVAVVVNPKNSMSNLSRSELRKCLREKSEPGQEESPSRTSPAFQDHTNTWFYSGC